MGAVKPDTRSGETLSNRTHAGRWSVPFPYGMDADELVSRRQLLRLTVLASGALFAATGMLAGLGYARDRRRGEVKRVIEARAVAEGDVHYFDYGVDDQKALLLHLAGGRFVAYSGKCTHLSCAVYFDKEHHELVCPCHEGIFEPETGEVLAGPPPRPLERITLREEDGVLFAVEQVPQ